jgi:hypothetical protein
MSSLLKQFQKLLQLQKYRVESAEIELFTARQKVELSEEKKREAQKKLDDFRKTLAEQEKTLFKNMCGKVVDGKSVGDSRQASAHWRWKLSIMEREIMEAEEEVEVAKKSLEQIAFKHKQEQKKSEKYGEFNSIEKNTKFKINEFHEEAVLEEFRGKEDRLN